MGTTRKKRRPTEMTRDEQATTLRLWRRRNQYGCDLMAQQRGIIGPERYILVRVNLRRDVLTVILVLGFHRGTYSLQPRAAVCLPESQRGSSSPWSEPPAGRSREASLIPNHRRINLRRNVSTDLMYLRNMYWQYIPGICVT